MEALDLFCCGGGATRGLVDAGLRVTGVDVDGSVAGHYTASGADGFIEADVLGWLDANAAMIAERFALVWASPPCQAFSVQTRQHDGAAARHPDLVEATRIRLRRIGVPHVIENVPRAPIRRDLMLCGKMFGLDVARHRHFELHGFGVSQPDHRVHMDGRRHRGRIITVTGNPGGSSTRDGGSRFGSTEEWREVMGIGWLPSRLLREAIPPAYSRHIAAAFLGTSAPHAP